MVAASVGPNTTAVLAAAQQQVNALLATPKGVQKLTQDFELCAPPQTERDTATFLSAITDPIAETVQYNDDANRRSFDITTIQTIMSATADPYTALVNLWNAYNVHTNNTQCTDISYANMIAEMQSTSDGRSWTWQTCTEFGYFQVSAQCDSLSCIPLPLACCLPASPPSLPFLSRCVTDVTKRRYTD